VLVAGGLTLENDPSASAEIYDPATNTWTVIPPLYSHGTSHTATLLKDGRVLVVGGCIGSGVCTERAEIFDPQRNAWTEAAPLDFDRANHSALLLDDGRVLIAGGQSYTGSSGYGSPLIYDPAADTWTAAGTMTSPRDDAQMVRLQDGRVLVAGGLTLENDPSASAEIYDPATNTWSAADSLNQARYDFAMALLPNGQVLAIGGARDYSNGWNGDSFVSEIESYNPQADRWHVVGDFPQTEAEAAVVSLPDGRLWLTGGRNGFAPANYLADTWLISVK